MSSNESSDRYQKRPGCNCSSCINAEKVFRFNCPDCPDDLDGHHIAGEKRAKSINANHKHDASSIELIWTSANYGRYRADEVTDKPVTVEWEGGPASPTWEVTVDPYAGAVVVNGRVYDVSVLVSEDVDPRMYRERRTGKSGGEARD